VTGCLGSVELLLIVLISKDDILVFERDKAVFGLVVQCEV